jgi:hypothetical protein
MIRAIFFWAGALLRVPAANRRIHGRTGRDWIKIGNKFNISDLVAETIGV